MKLSIIYYGKTGKTKKVARGMGSHEGIKVGVFDVDHVHHKFLDENKAVVFETPTYLANTISTLFASIFYCSGVKSRQLFGLHSVAFQRNGFSPSLR